MYTKYSIEIKESLKWRRPEYYSQPLVQQRLKVGALSHNLHKLRQGIDHGVQIIERMQRAGIELKVPPEIEEAKSEYKKH